MKKKLFLPLIFLSSVTAGQAALTLVSGFTDFTTDENGVIKSNVGANLTLNLGSGTLNPNGSLSSKGTTKSETLNPAQKTNIDLSSLGLSGGAGGTGYTININFNSAASLHNQDSIFSLNTAGGAQDNMLARYETGNVIGITNNGSTTNRPGAAISTTINFTNPFILTLSVQAGGAYSLFVTQGTTQALAWAGISQTGMADKLFLGSWSQYSQHNTQVDISSIGIYSGAATINDLPLSISVPEPTTASLGLFGLTALLLRRRRTVA